MFKHKASHAMVIIMTFVVTVITVMFALLSIEGDKNVLFEHSLGDLRERYQTDVLPNGPLCPVSFIVYTFQGLWTIYAVTLIWRKSRTGYLYISPNFLPIIVHLTYSVGLIFKIVWFFLWDKEKHVIALVLMVGSSVCIIAALVLSLWYFGQHGQSLVEEGLKADVILMRLFVHNGLCMLATWLALQTIIDVSIVAHFNHGMDQRDASSLSLGIMAVVLLVSVFLDLYHDKYTRYMLALYPITIALLACILSANFDPDERNSIITLLLALVMGVFFIVKLILILMRSSKNAEPLVMNQGSTGLRKLENDRNAISSRPVSGQSPLPSQCGCSNPNYRPSSMVTQQPVALTTMSSSTRSQPAYVSGTPMGVLHVSRGPCTGSNIGSTAYINGSSLAVNASIPQMSMPATNSDFGGYPLDTRSNLI